MDSRSNKSASQARSVATARTAATSVKGSRMGSKAGSVKAGPGGHLSQTLNVAHLQELCRIYLMLAKMAGNRDEAVRSLLVSRHYLVRAVSMSAAGVTRRAAEAYEKGLEKIAEEGGDGAAADAGDGAAAVPVVYEIPSSTEAWIGWDMPEGLCEACMAEKEMDVLSPRTVPKPELLASYLEWSLGALKSHGLQLECLPILCVYGYIAKHMLRSESLLALTRLWQGQLYADMGLWQEALKNRELAGPALVLSAEQEREYEQELQQRDLLRTASRQGSAGKETSRPNPSIKVLRPLQEYEVWVRIAQAKMEEGDSKLAKTVLRRTMKHAHSNEDWECEGLCMHLLAKLAGLEGHISQAIALEREAQNHTNVFEFWTDSSRHLAEMMTEESLTVYGAHSLDDGLSVLAICEETLGKVLESQPNLRNEIVPLRSSLSLKAAQLTLANSVRQDELGSIMWRKAHDEHRASAQASCDELSALGGGPQYVRGLLLRAEMEEKPVSRDPAERQNQVRAQYL